MSGRSTWVPCSEVILNLSALDGGGTMLGLCPGGMRGRNGRACRVQNVPRQNTLKRGLRTGVRKPVTFTILSIVI